MKMTRITVKYYVNHPTDSSQSGYRKDEKFFLSSERAYEWVANTKDLYTYVNTFCVPTIVIKPEYTVDILFTED